MSGRIVWRGVPIVTLAALAAFGPLLCGPAGPPSVAASAAQLLAPGTRIQEVTLGDGGYARALEVQLAEDGIRVRSVDGWRALSGVRASGPVRSERLWLGSDQQGRSLLARTLHGARTSLLVALLATALALAIGTSLGLASTLTGSIAGGMIEVVTDGLLGLPRLLLLLMLGVLLGDVNGGTALAIGLGSWMEVARLVQAESTRQCALPFVAAARGSGAGPLRLAAVHLLPNLAPILLVTAPLVATEAVLLEATLSFLGLSGGSAASWGSIVADGQRLLPVGWWIVVFPGVLLCATAFAVHGVSRRGEVRSLTIYGPGGGRSHE